MRLRAYGKGIIHFKVIPSVEDVQDMVESIVIELKKEFNSSLMGFS